MSLNQYFRTNVGLPIHKWYRYLPLYEKYFAPFRDRHIFFLEIGTGNGGSSRMWSHYFGPCAQIVTLDIREECKKFETAQIKVRVGSQDNLALLQSIVDEFGPPDVILDDGSHIMDHVKASFQFLYPRMNREALYFIEDLHTAYWPAYGGGFRKPGTFIEEAKGLIDELYANNPENSNMDAGDIPSSEIGKTIRGIHFHESIVVFEKGPFVERGVESIPHPDGILY